MRRSRFDQGTGGAKTGFCGVSTNGRHSQKEQHQQPCKPGPPDATVPCPVNRVHPVRHFPCSKCLLPGKASIPPRWIGWIVRHVATDFSYRIDLFSLTSGPRWSCRVFQAQASVATNWRCASRAFSRLACVLLEPQQKRKRGVGANSQTCL